ncbi:hypothetical protein PFISCL1PPCAC_11028, partial [Pristionchus fissidentatus]
SEMSFLLEALEAARLRGISNTIKLTVEEWSKVMEGEKVIKIATIGDFHWKLIALRRESTKTGAFMLECTKGVECPLWCCETRVYYYYLPRTKTHREDYTFNSWDKYTMARAIPVEFTSLAVEIEIAVHNRRRFPSLDIGFLVRPKLGRMEARDGCLVVEERIIYSLASQSSYFNTLFFGGFKETNQNEIELKDVSHQELYDVISIMNGDKEVTS